MKQQQDLIPATVGETLKTKRIARKLSVTEVADAINLDAHLLRKIEEDEAGHIAPVYMNGYLRSYAKYLRFSSGEIQQLMDQMGGEKPVLRTVFTESPKGNVFDNWLHASSYVLASLLIGTLVWQFTHEAVRLSQDGSGLRIEPQGMQSTDTSRSRQAQTGPVNASITSLGVLDENSTAKMDTTQQAWAAVSRGPLPAGESRLQISVSADSWVEISDAGGRELEMDLLRGGSEKSYRGKTPFRILIGRASAVRLSMNGKEVDMSPFSSGDVVQMTWPQEVQGQEHQLVSGTPDSN